MKKNASVYCRALAFVLVLISLTSYGANVRAQFLTNDDSTTSQGRFSPKDFGAGGRLSFSSGLEDASSEPLTVKAKIVAPPTEDASVDAARKPIGYLSIRTTVAPGWHIYSPTQGAGGKPTKFNKLTAKDAEVEFGAPMLATEVTLARDALGSTLEELLGKVDWLTPIYASDGQEQIELESLVVKGEVDALACSEGEGGACVPQNVKFTARFADGVDVAPILAKARELGASNAEPSPTQDLATVEGTVEEAPNATDVNSNAQSSVTTFASRNIFVLLVIAFFGGFILNFTPCVLPVVGLKILSFFQQAGKSRKRAFTLNVWYAVGTLAVFGALAFASVGLSFLFTRALFQIIMSAIVFIMALSLMGVWELQTPAFLGGEKSNELTEKEGAVGAVFKGIITTLLAIPCGAPLLSPALDWASETTRQGDVGLVVVIYLVIGLGMASPFLIAGAFPELLKFFPKPGAWLETFRKTMGYFLLIAVLWIVYSAPIEYQLPTLAFLFALWFACWNIGRNQYEIEAGRKKTVGWLVSLAVVVIVALFSFTFKGNPIKTTLQSASEAKMTRWAIRANRDGRLTQEHWALFDRATLDRELANGRPVVVDFTADWCMNCKFLEKTILHTQEIQDAFDAKNALTLTADWTNQDAQTPDVVAINELLDAHGARQVPTLMIFTPEAPEAPVVLRGLYTKSALLEALATLPDQTDATNGR